VFCGLHEVFRAASPVEPAGRHTLLMVLNRSLSDHVFPPVDKLPLLGHGRYQGAVLRDLIPFNGHQ
jgi:hypothetical protein